MLNPLHTVKGAGNILKYKAAKHNVQSVKKKKTLFIPIQIIVEK